ncbi:MAG: hypothetical protein ACK4TI_00595, partial [Nitrososphaerales archaeon]
MPTPKSTAPFTGLVLVILSIITLRIEAPLFAAASFLMALLGLILILLPDLKGVKMKPRQSLVRSELSSSTTLDEATDRCAICGKPVPPDVA